MNKIVTTDPFTIMLINMTIVFAVLYGLSWIIRLIRYIDPTRKKEEATPILQPTPPTTLDTNSPTTLVTDTPTVAAPGNALLEDNFEIAAVIAAAVMAYGYPVSQLVAIRHAGEQHWIKAARIEGVSARNQRN